MPQSTLPLGHKIILFIGRLAIFLILSIFIGLIIFLVQESFSPSWLFDFNDTLLGHSFLNWIAFFITISLSLWLLHLIINRRNWATFGFSRQALIPALGTGYLSAIILLLVFFVLLWFGGWLQIVNVDFQPTLFFGWFAFFLIQPFTEELLMRSFLQNQLHYFFGPLTGILGVAIVFCLLHTTNNHFSWIAGLQIFSGGILMGLLFLKYQSIWAAFAFHSCWNFFQSTILGFAVSGMETYHLLQLNIQGPEWLTGGNFGVEGSLLSTAMLIVAIIYFWPSAKNMAPLPAFEPTAPMALP